MAKKVNKAVVVTKELTPGELQKLAHAGTKEALAKIEKYIKTEKDQDKREFAEMALEECEFFYYEPKNDKEEEEFLLCELIRRRELDIEDMITEAYTLQTRLERATLEGKVHEKVLAKHKNKKETWQYNWMTDFVTLEQNELQRIEDQIAYDEAWVVEAKKMITTARYKNIPARYMESLQFDFDDEEIFDEDDECFDCEDDCDSCNVEFDS